MRNRIRDFLIAPSRKALRNGDIMKNSGRKYYKALVNLGVAAAVLLLILFLLPRLVVFFAPFVAGWIIAWIANPIVHFFEKKLKIRRKAGSAFVIVMVVGLVVLAIYAAGSLLLDQGLGLLSALPDMWESMEGDFEQIARNFSVIYEKLPQNMQDAISQMSNSASEALGQLVGMIGTPTIAAAGSLAMQLPSILIAIIMSLLSAYFFVAEREQIGAWLHRHMPRTVLSRYDMLRRSLLRAVGGYFKAQLRIEMWMYLLIVIGLTILRVNYGLLIGLGIAMLDFFPVFGTGTVLVPWAVIKILSADYGMAVGLLIIWGVGQLVRQIIQPKIMGDSVGMPPLPTLILLYAGYRLGGVLGMILAVPLGIILYTMYEEGVFDTTKNSVRILAEGLNSFRRLKPEDLEGLGGGADRQ